MPDKDKLAEAAKNLQSSLAKANLTFIQKVLAGVEPAPLDTEITTRIGGLPCPGMNVTIQHLPSGNMATLSIVGKGSELRSVSVDDKDYHWDQLRSNPAEEKDFKDAIEKLTKTCPQIGALIVGSCYSRSGDKVVAPAQEPVVERSR